MKLKELIEEKILPKATDKEDKQMRRKLKFLNKKEKEDMLKRINTVRKSEGKKPFTIEELKIELKSKKIQPKFKRKYKTPEEISKKYRKPEKIGSLSLNKSLQQKYSDTMYKREIEGKKIISYTKWKEENTKRTNPIVGDLISYKTGNKIRFGKVLKVKESTVLIKTPNGEKYNILPISIVGHKK